MSDLEVVALPNGQFAENCYLIADRRSREAVIVDPGEGAATFLAELDSRAWTLQGIWLTHAHIDHILGVGAVHAATGASIHLHPLDLPIYDALPQYGAWLGMQVERAPPPDRELQPGQVLRVGAFEFTVRFTPGHSPGSVSFVGEGMIFGGDVLFSGSVGRTDLPGGDPTVLLASIQTEFLSLPDSVVVHSGHGPPTTIGIERLTNPFLTGAYRLG
ncbi:MAG TPA: MBL fold metallo-hydrolase [Gemmatimonadales bacterium]|nr:MBL fold metallo-hydrolase [Gemmatimonadales bacterium]